MSDFEERFRTTTSPYKRAHVVLNEFSRKGAADLNDINVVESASFGVLIKSASDTHAAERRRLSKPRSAEELFSQENIVLSAIGMSRNDIAKMSTVQRSADKAFKFRMTEQNGFVYPALNHDADDEYLFDQAEWEKERLEALDVAIGNGAQIICFGENDFIPYEKLNTEFCEKIQARIDAKDYPIFLVAGTTHEYESNGANHSCFNRAKVFANKEVKNHERPDEDLFVEKLNAAEHAGEKISVPERPRVQYFDTTLGRIAVLVCVDAYNPTVLISLLANRAKRGNDQIDYVLVPSYNQSAKLYYSCQVLSLVAGCVVMLVDACSESEKEEKPAETAVFVHGRLFSDLVTENADVGQYETESPHSPVRSCNISLDYLNELRATENAATPFLNQVSNMFSNKKLRGL